MRIANDLDNLGREFSKYLKDFIPNCQHYQCCKKVEYECVFRKLQKLFDTLTHIDKTLVNNRNVKQSVREAVMLLHFTYIFMALAVTGINSSTFDLLYQNNCYVSENLKFKSLSFEYALQGAVNAIADITLPLENVSAQSLPIPSI